MAPNQVTGPITIQLCGQLPPKIGCLLVAFPHRTGMLVYRIINHPQIGSSIVNHPFWRIPSVGNGWPSTSNRSSSLGPDFIGTTSLDCQQAPPTLAGHWPPCQEKKRD